jgi:hypothetical protein
VSVYAAISPSARPSIYRAEIDPRAADNTESDAGRVRLLGYRVSALNAGLPTGKNAYCQALFFALQKVETGRKQA